MRIAYSRGTGSPSELTLLLRTCARVGYDGLCLRPSQYEPWLADPGAFVHTYGSLGCAVAGVHVGGGLDGAGVARLRAALRFVRALGGERVVLAHRVDRRDLSAIDLRAAARQLCDLGHEAADQGVALSLQNHLGGPAMYRKDLEVLFDAIDDETVWWTADVSQLYLAGEFDIAGLLREFRFALDNVHLNDCAGGTCRALGQGEVPLAPVFAALQEIGFGGWLTVHDDSGLPLETAAAAGYEYVLGALGRREATAA
ncbi:MAG: sugar phosphate isomerase/epimerase [Chloroflexi bacterium]|nr:sugar phosphate isomerase/epimerase [Chloroflexota bacterium]